MLLRGRYTSAAVPRMYPPNTSPEVASHPKCAAENSTFSCNTAIAAKPTNGAPTRIKTALAAARASTAKPTTTKIKHTVDPPPRRSQVNANKVNAAAQETSAHAPKMSAKTSAANVLADVLATSATAAATPITITSIARARPEAMTASESSSSLPDASGSFFDHSTDHASHHRVDDL